MLSDAHLASSHFAFLSLSTVRFGEYKKARWRGGLKRIKRSSPNRMLEEVNES